MGVGGFAVHAVNGDNVLGAQAMALADSDPELGTKRALEAVSLAKGSSVAASALRANLSKLPSLQLPIAEGYK